jgi:hypothetical protein
MLVQKAKPRLLEWEALATNLEDWSLLWPILHMKLFSRIQEMYRNQLDWIRDAIAVSLFLIERGQPSEKRDTFGDSVLRVTERFMKAVAESIAKFEARWCSNRFLFSVLALWKAATEYRIQVTCLASVEQYLRTPGNSLSDEDLV